MAAFQAVSPDALEEALPQALTVNAPALLHVPVGKVPSPRDMILWVGRGGPAGTVVIA